MATSSSIQVSIDADTITFLQNNKFTLCIFRGIYTSHERNFFPLVMSSSTQYMGSNNISISDDNLGGYNSTAIIREGVKITAEVPKSSREAMNSSNSTYIAIGQKMIIGEYGNLSLKNGDGKVIEIENNSSTSYTTGIGSIERGNRGDLEFQLFCAGQSTKDSILKVLPSSFALLVFTDDSSMQAGVYKKVLPNAGFLIQTAEGKKREVNYSKDDGWSANNEVWGKKIKQESDLASVLILPLPSS